jgi:hypothetical protein
MGKLSEWLARACAELNLRIDFDYHVPLPAGQGIVAIARIRDLGAPNGMLIFGTYARVRTVSSQIVSASYGYSVLDEPRADEDFDLDGFKEVFIDWGWAGDVASKPVWMGSTSGS